MFERDRKVFSFGVGTIERLMADVRGDELSAQPVAGMNPPRWILGHLACAVDYGMRLLDQPMSMPQEWHVAFAPGSKPVNPGGPQPAKDELLTAMRQQHDRLLAALDVADPALFDRSHDVRFETLRQFFPTRGDLLVQLMTGHQMFHIGQLSAWRRATGRAALF